MSISRCTHINALGIKFDLAVKKSRSTQNNYFANLMGPTFPMLNTKSQGHRASGSGELDFKGFSPYMGMVAILVM